MAPDRGALANIMAPYSRLLGIGRQLPGALLVTCPRTDRLSNWESIMEGFCSWVSHSTRTSTAQGTGPSCGI